MLKKNNDDIFLYFCTDRKVEIFLGKILVSNAQEINSAFWNRDFEIRQGIFGSYSSATAEKNNEVLSQKNITQMVELFFERYL